MTFDFLGIFTSDQFCRVKIGMGTLPTIFAGEVVLTTNTFTFLWSSFLLLAPMLLLGVLLSGLIQRISKTMAKPCFLA